MTNWNPVVETVDRWSRSGVIGVSVRTLTGECWESQSDRRFVAASTIKIPVMIALHRQFDAGPRNPHDIVMLGHDRVPGTGVLQHLHPGLELTLDDLCSLMISISDNTATNMLVDLVSLDAINAAIRDLGMSQSSMARRMLGRRATGEDAENWVTAADLTGSIMAILTNRAASPASCERMKHMMMRQDQCRRVTRFAPAGSCWGSKPGSLEGIVNDAGFIQSDRGTVVVSVCCEGIASDYDAERAIAEIASAAIDVLGLGG